ncbi:GGDEF domain-containing protein [Agaribacter marinus]|uniref:GGDEF domain-containing protein n=1 Tax=Agaribacter marinus TaxID=1431249 RepID=UPI0024E08B6B|nr:GGDEF domain-containing protein [Agaribacter marinus]
MHKSKQKTIRLFIYAQFAILALFSLLTFFTLYRLLEVGSYFTHITNKTIPDISRSYQLNNQIEKLLTSTVTLSNVQNDSARRLMNIEVQNTLSDLNHIIFTNQTDEFLTKQIYVLAQELEELDVLVAKRISIEKLLAEKQSLFIEYVQSSFIFHELNEDNQAMLFDALLLASEIKQETRLHKLRRIETQITSKLDPVLEQLEEKSKHAEVFRTVKHRLLSEQGLLNLRIESLRIIGRAKGRGSFVRNLLADVARDLEYQATLSNDAIIQSSNSIARGTEKQTYYALAVGAICTVLALAIIYFIYRRIVVRLIQLKRQVDEATINQQTEIVVSGNDEIAWLAKAFSTYVKRVNEQESALLNMTLSDPLTGIPNRRAFEKYMDSTLAQARRHGWYLSVMLIDVDSFKPYNDHYGHPEGDACLRLVANQLSQSLGRNSDLCARYGGEEFVCILPSTDAEGAKYKAELLRQAVEDLAIEHDFSNVSAVVTVSIGVATFKLDAKSDVEKSVFLACADKKLYEAKEGGRNRCAYYSKLPEKE